jgi:MoaA/NifB/PqqE/SkfB family radical SAM enzyme
MCSRQGGDKGKRIVPFDNILRQIKEGYPEHTVIEFTGGEPTVRPKLAEAIHYAKKIGYTKISISTNGRQLGNLSYAKKLVASGLTFATIALHGPDSKTHDAITRHPGSFKDLMAGIENLQRLNVQVLIASVLCRLNASVFHNIPRILISLGINSWSISDIVPESRGNVNYNLLAVDPEILARFGREILPFLEKFSYVAIFNFSRCVFPVSLPKNIQFFDIEKRLELCDIQGKSGRFRMESNQYVDTNKSRLPVCEKCRYGKQCGGFWTEYIKKYGPQPILKIVSR